MSVKYEYDSTANDQDKTFTVKVGRTWKLMYGLITYVATATVGNRLIEVIVKNAAAETLFKTYAGFAVTASQTINFRLVTGTPTDTSADSNSFADIHIPDSLIMAGGWTIQFIDNSGTDAADDMTVGLVYSEQYNG